MKRIVLGGIMPLLIGAGVAILFAPGEASALRECERNVCRTSVGNCDLSSLHLSCKETAGGCETTGCDDT